MGFAVGRKSAVLTAVFMLAIRPAAGQSRALATADIEEHIQHVTAGLIGGVVLKGQEHDTHTLSERMKTLNVPGVSIAVIHQGKIEWARGFGVGEIGGTPVNAETMFQAGSISKPIAALAALKLVQESKLAA